MSENKTLQGASGNSAVSVALVRKLLHRNARSAVAKIFTKAYAVEVARIISALGGYERVQAFSILLEECEASQVAGIISELDSSDSKALLERLRSEERRVGK